MTATTPRHAIRALTLIEMMMVIVILAALAGLLVPLFGGVEDEATLKTTQASMRRVQEAIVGSDGKPGYLADMRNLPQPDQTVEPGRPDLPQLRYLFINPRTVTVERDFNPETTRGWRGPYLVSPRSEYIVDLPRGFTTDFGNNGDEAALDAWGNPMVIQQSLTEPMWQLVSAGPDGVLDTTDDLMVDLVQEEALP